jgi:hypothetical protein
MPHDLRIPQQRELALANARLLLEGDSLIGSVVVRDGRIAAIDTGPGVPRGAEDLGGDFLCPGLIELHTDNLERHLEPRPGVRWPQAAAILAHDAELAGTGITTVFDALRVGSLVAGGKAGYGKYARPLASALGRLHHAGALRIRHRLHLRAELCSETLEAELDEFGPDDRVGIVSLMDHTPGQRQFTDISKLRDYATGRRGMTEAEFGAHVALLTGIGDRHAAWHRSAAVAAARRLGATVASHDDATEAHVAESAAHGGGSRRLPGAGDRGDDGRAQPDPRQVAFRQRRGRGARRGRAARRPLLRLRAGEPAHRRRPARAGDWRHGGRVRHRDGGAGPRGRARGPRPDRAGPRRRPAAFPHRGRPADAARRLGRRRPGGLTGGCYPTSTPTTPAVRPTCTSTSCWRSCWRG